MSFPNQLTLKSKLNSVNLIRIGDDVRRHCQQTYSHSTVHFIHLS
jgi:hypothetical protein